MSERSVLRVAPRQHLDPNRKGEWIVEVWRGGAVVAHIYGTHEVVQVVSERVRPDRPFYFHAAESSVVVPLLAEGEVCPWCGEGSLIRPCPICGKAEA